MKIKVWTLVLRGASLWVICGLPPLSASTATELKPFTSDGCSAFPDGRNDAQKLWLHCCTTHDLAYWQGGTYQQRLEADQALQACVRAIGEPEVAALMLAGVRVGGTPYLPTRFRWGYGWHWPRFYSPLTDQERALITTVLAAP